MKTENSLAVTNKAENSLATVDLESNNALPNLQDATAYPFDLMADYWTPETPGETKRVFFDKFASRAVIDQQSSELLNLECAYFIEPGKDGTVKSISNGSKRLVGALEASNIQRGTPLQITYVGKLKNKSNGFKSDNWSIKPLRINVA